MYEQRTSADQPDPAPPSAEPGRPHRAPLTAAAASSRSIRCAKAKARPDVVRGPACALSGGAISRERAPHPAPVRAINARAAGLGAALLVLPATAVAFPLIDPTNQDQVPTGTELATPDAQNLQHQLQLVNGLTAPVGGGWTFLPRLSVQEELTDNVFQQHSPRRWDLVTYVSPGIGIAGDLPRLQLTFDIAPTLALYARNSSLNALTEELSGTGLVTLDPDFAFIDLRAVSGVHNAFGGIGGLGTVGAGAGAGATAIPGITTIQSLAGNSIGLTKDNEVQTESYAVSPYLLHRFGDYGTGKLGYSLAVTRSDLLSGFFASPLPTGSGSNGQSQVTNEEIAHFATGEFLGKLQDSFDVDLQQSNSSTDAGFATATTGLALANNTITSTREIVTDQVNYLVNREITVFVSGGHEDITYSSVNSGFGQRPIDDLTWSFGTTLTPNPDSRLTVSYGHQNGFNSFSADGFYALTARTTLTVTYGSTLGTQLQNLQNQLNQATTGAGTATLINAQTGGQLFNGINALAEQEGVYRTDTLSLGSTTTLDRDIFAANLFLTKQTQAGGGSNTGSTTSTTFALNWTHELRPDLLLSSSVSYSVQDQGTASVLIPGNSTSIAASVALQYQISDTLSASLRYSFFDRSSPVSTFNVYQNIFIVGISKTF